MAAVSVKRSIWSKNKVGPGPPGPSPRSATVQIKKNWHGSHKTIAQSQLRSRGQICKSRKVRECSRQVLLLSLNEIANFNSERRIFWKKRELSIVCIWVERMGSNRKTSRKFNCITKMKNMVKNHHLRTSSGGKDRLHALKSSWKSRFSKTFALNSWISLS